MRGLTSVGQESGSVWPEETDVLGAGGRLGPGLQGCWAWACEGGGWVSGRNWYRLALGSWRPGPCWACARKKKEWGRRVLGWSGLGRVLGWSGLGRMLERESEGWALLWPGCVGELGHGPSAGLCGSLLCITFLFSSHELPSKYFSSYFLEGLWDVFLQS